MKKTTRVLIVATSRKTRGGITSVVIAHEQGKQWEEYHCRWIETHQDGNKITKINYALTGFLSFIIHLPFYDIVHFHVSFQGSLTRKFYLSKLARLAKKKVIVHFHPPGTEVLHDSKNYFKYKELFGTADKILVLSNEWKRLLIEQFDINKNIEILYNPCPKAISILADNTKENNRYILFAGTLIERKGYKTLITAFSKIAGNFPQWRLQLAGNGEIEIAKALIKQYNTESQIFLKGWLPKEEMNDLYREASIFCLSSSGEGFPMVVLEAWAYGVPVVTTLVGGLPDVVVDKINALTFEYGDIENLAAQLTCLMNDSELRIKISNESLILSKDIFSSNLINLQLGEIYKKLAE